MRQNIGWPTLLTFLLACLPSASFSRGWVGRPSIIGTAAFGTAKGSNENSGDGGDGGIVGITDRLLILRHGETDANAGGRIQGSSDVSRLTENGRRQAAEIASDVIGPFGKMSNNGLDRLDAVFLSPLSRAQETWSIVRSGLEKNQIVQLPSTSQTLSDLREVDLYDWEGRSKIDIQNDDPEMWNAWTNADASSLVISGNRPLLQLWDRAGYVWDTIRTLDEDQPTTTLLVCHGTLGKALLARARGMDVTMQYRLAAFPNCGMAEIQWERQNERASKYRWIWPHPSEWDIII